MVTLKEIAEKAGVSIGTVSKVLNNRIGKQNFGPECIQRIKRTARQLGYIPNYHARSLKSGKSHTIGLLLGGGIELPWNEYWAALIGGMMAGARQHNYHFININESNGETPSQTALRFLQEQRIDALVLPRLSSFNADLKLFSGQEFPIVTVLNQEETGFPSITVDECSGIAFLTEHLRSLGHTNLLWVGPETQNNTSALNRFKGFESVCTEQGIDHSEVFFPSLSYDKPWSWERAVNDPYRSVADHMSDFNPATGIVCYNDASAAAVYRLCAENNISIPESKSVAAFDDGTAQFLLPPCTSAGHMLKEIGQRAAEIAVEMAEGKNDYTNHRELIPSGVIIRNSTSPVGRVNK
jgi:DNA-binding LacI/PurR family transcriptional regulator